MAKKEEQKRDTVIQTSTDLERGQLVITFPRIDKQLRIEVAKLEPAIVEQAAFHGLKQKLVDAAAITRDPETGKAADDEAKFAAVKKVFDRLTGENPTWNAPREGGDGGASMLVKALCRMMGKDRATVEEWLKGKNDAEKKALRANPKVVEAIAAIQAESADKNIDSDSLLAELGE